MFYMISSHKIEGRLILRIVFMTLRGLMTQADEVQTDMCTQTILQP